MLNFYINWEDTEIHSRILETFLSMNCEHLILSRTILSFLWPLYMASFTHYVFWVVVIYIYWVDPYEIAISVSQKRLNSGNLLISIAFLIAMLMILLRLLYS